MCFQKVVVKINVNEINMFVKLKIQFLAEPGVPISA